MNDVDANRRQFPLSTQACFCHNHSALPRVLLFFLTLWVFIMGGMFPAVAKTLPAYRLSSEGSGYQHLTLETADLVPCCSPSGYEVERTTDAAGRLETVTVKHKGTVIHSYTNSFNATSHEISGVDATGFSSSYNRANPDTRAITKITRGTVEQNWGRGTAGRITSAGNSISDVPTTARLYINETEMTPFTGGWFFNIPSPGQNGGWVPWVVKGVLEDAGDHEPNDDAIAEVAGITWVPPANESFSYDADGNRETSSLWTHGWDGRNMLVSATTNNYSESPEGWRVTCDYDAEGRRFKKTVIHKTTRAEQVKETLDNVTFIWDGWNLIYEHHANQFGTKTFDRKYVWGEDLGGGTGGASGAGGAGGLLLIRETRGQAAPVDYYPLYDGSGHVVGLTDSAGTLVAQYTYGPFGELISASGPMADANPIRYATKYFDKETGLYYFGRRYYDPATGQWLNREPLGEDESLNLYAYCHNDPVNSVDVLGLATVLIGNQIASSLESLSEITAKFATPSTSRMLDAAMGKNADWVAYRQNVGLVGGIFGKYITGVLAAAYSPAERDIAMEDELRLWALTASVRQLDAEADSGKFDARMTQMLRKQSQVASDAAHDWTIISGTAQGLTFIAQPDLIFFKGAAAGLLAIKGLSMADDALMLGLRVEGLAAKGPLALPAPCPTFGSSLSDMSKSVFKNGSLPDNFITKAEAKALGWNPKAGNLDAVAPGKSIGGDVFGNKEGLLPSAPGRTWFEADLNYTGSYREGERLLYSNDGKLFYSGDHYKTFQQIGN